MDTKLFVRKQPGGMFSIIDKEQYPGSIFYVGSTVTGASDAAGFGQNPDAPCATIDYAVGLCTASAGDVIFVLPGHSEVLTAATSLVADIAGVSIIGIGHGSLMPLLTYTTAAAATLSITAADCKIQNIAFLSNFTNGITAGIVLGASADGCILDGLKFTETANTKEWLIGVSVTADCDDVIIRNCRYMGIAGGTTSSAITLAGGCDRLIFKNNYIHGDFSGSVLDGLTAASTDIQIIGNRCINIDTGAGLGIDFHDSSTGMMADNRMTNLKDTVEGFTGNGLAFHECYGSNALNVQGILEPVVDS